MFINDNFSQIKSYYYVGGKFGLSNERAIMQDIYENGPVILNFSPKFDFMFYSGGIYHSTEAADWILKEK